MKLLAISCFNENDGTDLTAKLIETECSPSIGMTILFGKNPANVDAIVLEPIREDCEGVDILKTGIDLVEKKFGPLPPLNAILICQPV